MEITINSKKVTIEVGDIVTLKNGVAMKVTDVYTTVLNVEPTGKAFMLNAPVTITPDEIVDVVKMVVETVGLIGKLIKFLKSKFSKK